MRYLLPALIFGALLGACATSSTPEYSEKITEFRDAVRPELPVDDMVAAQFFTAIEAYESGDFETACDELAAISELHGLATLQFVALGAEGRCDKVNLSRDRLRTVDYQTRDLFVVNPGICGGSPSGCTPEFAEYIEAAAWDRIGLLNPISGYHYYVGMVLRLQRYWYSINWLRAAADSGNPAAEFAVGKMMFLGAPGASDGLDAGLSYLTAAAHQGFPAAEYYVGEFYYYGRKPVSRDVFRAASWYRRAANHGSTRAQYSLGVLSRTGAGVARDETEALKWFILAARSGYPTAIRSRDELLSKLPTEQADLARREAKKWLEVYGLPRPRVSP